jgi:hypothetical protein
MTQQMPCSNSRFNKTISPDQLNEIIEAILAGKYSWACVLLLRATGYDPMHYIPYRTYNRLLKEHCRFGSPNQRNTDNLRVLNKNAATESESWVSQKGSSKIADLNYLEPVADKDPHIRGGSCESTRFPLSWLRFS